MATILGPFAQANIIGVDDRKPISEVFQSMKLDMVDMLRIRQSTGFVYCPGTVYGNPMRTSGAVVHDGSVIVTNAHSFIDDQGRRREPLNECYFRTQGVVPEIQYFDFTAGNFEMPEPWTMANDYAVVRLREPLQYARAFPIADSREVFIGRELILVSAQPTKPGGHFPMEEPVVQTCGIRRIIPATADHNDLFHGDCDITPGGSGSVGLVNVNGRLQAFATASGGGGPELNGLAYNANPLSFSFHTFFSGKVLAAIYRLSSSRGELRQN